MTPDGAAPPANDGTKRLARHVAIPAIMPALFFSVAFSPVAVLGCRTRGLMALAVASASGVWALSAAFAGAKARSRGDADASWWVIRSLVLTVPVVATLLMA